MRICRNQGAPSQGERCRSVVHLLVICPSVSRVRSFIAVFSLTLVLAACSSDSGFTTREVTRSDYGSAWPLTVDHAVLACEPGGVPTVTVKQRSYRLSETSADLSPGLLRVWVDDPTTAMPVSAKPLLDDALSLCD